MNIQTWENIQKIIYLVLDEDFIPKALEPQDLKKHKMYTDRYDMFYYSSTYLDGWACAFWTQKTEELDNPLFIATNKDQMIVFVPGNQKWHEARIANFINWEIIKQEELPKNFPTSKLKKICK